MGLWDAQINVFTAAASPVIGEKGMKEEGSPSGKGKQKNPLSEHFDLFQKHGTSA